MFVLDFQTFPNINFYKLMYFMIATLLYFGMIIYKKRIYIANLYWWSAVQLEENK